jgi:Domain of unknown function (DUF4326)
MPKRIQRQRTKGFNLKVASSNPNGVVYVGRPTWFGNPFTPKQFYDAGYSGNTATAISACVQAYREWLTGEPFSLHWREPNHFLGWLAACREDRVKRLPELRGKDLACYCPLDQPCHADVLLELANK